ncbi:MAG: YraN family protein [Bacteroidetes bacterium]|jgi:putative endonuclease|nr:YraN family protein [Bacteroidota bacterium]
MSTQPLGPQGEDLAVAYLLEHHYRILQRNYRYGHLEIDIVAMEGPELVFVEVKARSNFQYGEPEYFVTDSKQEKLRRAAQAYVEERVLGLVTCRFDVIAIAERAGRTEVRHLKDAFRG